MPCPALPPLFLPACSAHIGTVGEIYAVKVRWAMGGEIYAVTVWEGSEREAEGGRSMRHCAFPPSQVIGGLGMLDDGSDWKILAVKADSALAAAVDG